jgi:hypothetical protein
MRILADIVEGAFELVYLAAFQTVTVDGLAGAAGHFPLRGGEP